MTRIYVSTGLIQSRNKPVLHGSSANDDLVGQLDLSPKIQAGRVVAISSQIL